MYALFTAIPLIGHLNPLVYQAVELQRRGWRVAVASTAEVGAFLEREHPAVPFLALGTSGGAAAYLKRVQALASSDRDFARGALRIVRALKAMWPCMFDGLTDAVRQDRPDVMVVDLFSSAGMCVAEANAIPFVVNNANLLPCLPVQMLPAANHVPTLFSGRSIRAVGRARACLAPLLRRLAAGAAALTVGRDLNVLRRSRGLRSIDIPELLNGRPILVDGAFGLEYERALPANVHMVGAMLPAEPAPLPGDLAAWLDRGRPVVYVNLGTMTIATPKQLGTMRDALKEGPFRVLWIVGESDAGALAPAASERFKILPWGPSPLAVLSHPNVRAFVSHCGINSVHEAIQAGTPIVGIPMFADQLDMGVRLSDAGIGICLDKVRFTAFELRQALQQAMSDSSFAVNLARVRGCFQRAGGPARAADLIVQAARS